MNIQLSMKDGSEGQIVKGRKCVIEYVPHIFTSHRMKDKNGKTIPNYHVISDAGSGLRIASDTTLEGAKFKVFKLYRQLEYDRFFQILGEQFKLQEGNLL